MKKSLLFLSLFFLGIALWGQNGRFENNTTAKNSTINVPSTGNINPAHQGSGTTHFPVSITGIKTVPANPPSAAVVKTSVKNPSVTPGSTSNPMDNPPTPESEACGADLNGGCNMTIPAFEPIAFGESIAGTSWCDLSTRDTDWFIFTLTSGSTVTLTGQAEFPFTIGFIAAPCPAISFIDYTFGAAGETKSVTVALAAGTYYAWVGPSSWSTYIDCSGSNTYQISLSGTDECTGDVTPPVAIAKNISVPLNAAGTASITAADIDNGSTDNCAIASRAASKTAFACADKGPNNVTLTVTDLSGNTATANSVVTVVDAINPVAIVKNISITLNTLGMATITAADIDNGSTDNCAITSRAASKTTFACADLGANTVKLTVSDAAGNTATANSTVTVVEGTALPTPWASCVLGASNGIGTYTPCTGPSRFTLTSTGYSSPSADVQEFVYQNITGNGTIIANIYSLAGNGWAGVQIRENCSPSAKKVLLKTQLQTFLRSDIRNTTGGATVSTQILRMGVKWIKLTRTGNRFDAFTSADGIGWMSAFSTTMTMGATVQFGIMSEAINFTSTTTAKFDHVTVSVSAKSADALTPNQEASKEIKVYPNPANDYITIEIPEITGKVKCSMYSADGKILLSEMVEQVTTVFDVSYLKPGVYILRFDTEGEVVTRRLVVY